MKKNITTYYVRNVGKKGKGLFANRTIEKGEEIIVMEGSYVKRKDITPKILEYSLQIEDNLFIYSPLHTLDELVNHSCDANCFIKFPSLMVTALRTIEKGEEITFDYETTEYDLIDQGIAFECHCGASKCRHFIDGFKYMTFLEKIALSPYLSPYLNRKLERCFYSSKYKSSLAGILYSALLFVLFKEIYLA